MLLRGGRDYPRSVGELLARFATDADCQDYLAWLRWPDGFVCDACGHDGGWQVADGRCIAARCLNQLVGQVKMSPSYAAVPIGRRREEAALGPVYLT